MARAATRTSARSDWRTCSLPGTNFPSPCAMGSSIVARLPARIVRGVAEATGKAPEAILEAFAEAMVPGLLGVYGFLVNPRWSFLDLIVNTEGVIHKGVRVTSTSAKPPAIQAERVGPDARPFGSALPRRDILGHLTDCHPAVHG